MVNIKGLDKAAVLAALHNNTRSIGWGALHDIGRGLTVEEARLYIEKHLGYGEKGRLNHDSLEFQQADKRFPLSFDYVLGRPLKVDITDDEFDPRLYDRDAGPGAAERAIAPLRQAATA